MSEQWKAVGACGDLREGRGLRCRVGDDEVALWQVDGRFHAISAVCAHQHVSTLHEGIREGLTVSCPLHGWTLHRVRMHGWCYPWSKRERCRRSSRPRICV